MTEYVFYDVKEDILFTVESYLTLRWVYWVGAELIGEL